VIFEVKSYKLGLNRKTHEVFTNNKMIFILFR